MLSLLKSLWAGLIPIGLLFIALEIRCGFERCFRYFGIAQLLLCAMTGIDIWILPSARPLAVELAWTRAMFVVGCQFALFYFWYMAELTRQESRAFTRVLSAYALLLSALFFTDALLRIAGGAIVRGWGFDFLFQPFMALCLFGALVLILRRMRRAQGVERRLLGLHLAGFLMLFLFGCLDVVFTYYIPKPFFVSFNTFGSLAFGITMSLILLEKIVGLLREREAMGERVKEAFRDVAESRGLRLVGESAAMVHHEVKNHVALIKGNADLLAADAGLGRDSLARLERIRRSAEGLDGLARGILDLPSVFAIEDGGRTSVAALLEELIRKEFPDAPVRFLPDPGSLETRIHGDAGKLELVFYNLLKNAREAGAGRISVRCMHKNHVLAVSIEDDGPGCEADRLESLGKAFFTTRKGMGGHGLGICVAKAIIENHGGSLAFYRKNGIPALGAGLVANIVLPAGTDGTGSFPETRGIPILSPNADFRSKLARVAKNLLLVPLELPSSRTADIPPWDLILQEDGPESRLPAPGRDRITRVLRVRSDGYARLLSPDDAVLDEGLFCEMFLAGCL
jgi:signal transduction histidine kinase